MSFSHISTNFIKEYGLGSQPIPGVEKEKFYLLISRSYKYALALKNIIDKEVDVLESTGELKAMIDRSIEKLKAQSTN